MSELNFLIITSEENGGKNGCIEQHFYIFAMLLTSN